jgi:AraC family transcriptional regulator
MKAPGRTTAEVFPRYVGGEVLADSATLRWPGLFVRRYRYSRVVDGFLVPATAEPLITCNIAGSAEFEEREIGGGVWLPRRLLLNWFFKDRDYPAPAGRTSFDFHRKTAHYESGIR